MSTKGRKSATWKRVVPALLVLAATLLIPYQANAAESRVVIPGFPSVRQWYSLSCEYAAAAAVTLYWGNLVSQRDFIREVPLSPNPHEGFRGNINKPFGGIMNYGIYAEPLVPVLESRGYDATVYYGDVNRLKAELRAGHPVVVWFTSGQAPQPIYTRTYAGESFRLVPHEHSVVAYGYDSNTIYLMDVGNGGFYHTAWSSFLRRWTYLQQMYLVITPGAAMSSGPLTPPGV